MSLPLPRRSVLMGGASALTAAPLAMPRIGRAVEPIRIGLLLAKTGQISGQTEHLANGTYLALQQRNNEIMGQPAEIVWLDEPSPQVAAQNMQRLVQDDKAVAVLGGSLSSNALAEEAAAAQLKIPYVCTSAAATEITGRSCNRYTFRMNTPVLVQSRMLAPYALKFGKKWYFITAAYAYGQDVLRTSRELLRQAGGTEAGVDEIPLNTPDFSSIILKIRQAKPDVILGGLPAGDLSTFLRQWNELGMKGQIPFFEVAIADNDIWTVGAGAATGTFTKMWDFRNPANPPDEKAFAETYQRKYGKPAPDKAWAGWITARSLFEAIDAAKTTQPMAIVEALEAWKAPAVGYDYSYRRFDHQMLARNLAVTIKPNIIDRWDFFDVAATLPENVADLPAVFGTPAEVGCTMG